MEIYYCHECGKKIGRGGVGAGEVSFFFTAETQRRGELRGAMDSTKKDED